MCQPQRKNGRTLIHLFKPNPRVATVRYMGANDLLNKQITFEGNRIFFKDAVRNGLVHHYFMKVEQGVVVMITDDAEANRLGFLINDTRKVAMVVVPFFDLFCSGLTRAKSEGRIPDNRVPTNQ